MSLRETVQPESDGSLVADFDGDGLNDVAYDSNGDGYIDPTSEIALDGSSTPDLTLGGPDAGEYTDPYVSVKVGPLPELKVHRPIAYAFAITQGFALSGMGIYYAITHLVIFAGLRRRLIDFVRSNSDRFAWNRSKNHCAQTGSRFPASADQT